MTWKPKDDRNERLLSLKDAAARLGVSDWTVRRWALQGRITSAKIGSRRLIPEGAVTRMIEKAMQQAYSPDELRLD